MALSAKNFVAVRKIQGGPAAEALEPEIARAKEQFKTDEHWLSQAEQRQSEAKASMKRERDSLLRRAQ
jgi:argininosuccinate lyase